MLSLFLKMVYGASPLAASFVGIELFNNNLQLLALIIWWISGLVILILIRNFAINIHIKRE